MTRLGLAFLFLLGLTPAQAQQTTVPTDQGTIVCAYNSALPTVTSGQFGYVQCDSNGRLITSAGSGVTSAVNVTQFGSSNVVTGTGTSGTGIPRVTVSNDSVVSLSASSPGIITLGQTTTSASVPVTMASNQPYPVPPTSLTASATGTTAATVATLAATAAKTTYICGFTITSDATVGLSGAATVTNTITGTLNYIQGVGAIPAVVVLSQTFNPCIPASATNTTIVVTSAAAGTGGTTAVTAWGFVQ